MPYKCEKIRLTQAQDRRVKLTDEQKDDIRKLYATGEYSHKQLAIMYNVSKSLITLTVNAERAARVRERQKAHWREYVDREQLTTAARNWRRYKQGLYLKGELKND